METGPWKGDEVTMRPLEEARPNVTGVLLRGDLETETLGRPVRGGRPWEDADRRQPSVCEERGLSRTQPSDVWILDFKLQTVRKQISEASASRLGYFVVAPEGLFSVPPQHTQGLRRGNLPSLRVPNSQLTQLGCTGTTDLHMKGTPTAARWLPGWAPVTQDQILVLQLVCSGTRASGCSCL